MAMTMERSDSTDNQSNRARQAAAGKKRTVQSCVCCKTRKTKVDYALTENDTADMKLTLRINYLVH